MYLTIRFQLRKIYLLALLVFLSQLLQGCESISFYGQAARGQLSLLSSRQAITDLLVSQETDIDLMQKLRSVMALRAFASSELGLDVGQSYSSYVELSRPYVVWNVTASPEFAIEPKTWCFPIAGCVSYRGYFKKQSAFAKAGALEAQGYDVYVGGVAAYSTLGWFDDPVLSSFLRRSDQGLAALLFHELAHRQLYLKGDTTFNESFATTVAIEGLKRWFTKAGEEQKYTQYLDSQERRSLIIAMITKHRQHLKELYNKPISLADKRQRKGEIIEQIQVDYSSMKADWHNYRGFDAWMKSPINNAKLSTIASYNDWVPSFQQLLDETGGNLPLFYQRCSELTKLDKLQRDSELAALKLRQQNKK